MRGDDVNPRVRDDNIVPVARFGGSRLASGAVPVPFQQNRGQSGISRATKVARISSEHSTVAAAIVEAENNLENDVLSSICVCCLNFL
jgi:5'-3' exoribonuclease 2